MTEPSTTYYTSKSGLTLLAAATLVATTQRNDEGYSLSSPQLASFAALCMVLAALAVGDIVRQAHQDDPKLLLLEQREKEKELANKQDAKLTDQQLVECLCTELEKAATAPPFSMIQSWQSAINPWGNDAEYKLREKVAGINSRFVRELTNRISKAQKTAAANMQIAEVELSSAREQLSRAHEQIVDLDGRLMAMHNEMLVREFHITSSAQRASAAEINAQHYTARCHELQLQLAAMQAALAAERLSAEQTVGAKDAEISQLNGTITTHSTQIAALQQQVASDRLTAEQTISAKNTEISQLTTTVSTQSTQLAAVQQQLAEANHTIQTNPFQRRAVAAQVELATAKTALADANKDCQTQSQQNRALQQDLAKAHNTIRELQLYKQHTQKDIDNVNKVKVNMKSIEKQKKALEAEVAQLRIANGNKDAQHAAATALLQSQHAEQLQQYECTVCMENHIDTVFTPCGHMLCQSCCGQLRPPRQCHICRNGSTTGMRQLTG
jgi:Zinc finger, C3HC4 type (RING finger)